MFPLHLEQVTLPAPPHFRQFLVVAPVDLLLEDVLLLVVDLEFTPLADDVLLLEDELLLEELLVVVPLPLDVLLPPEN